MRLPDSRCCRCSSTSATCPVCPRQRRSSCGCCGCTRGFRRSSICCRVWCCCASSSLGGTSKRRSATSAEPGESATGDQRSIRSSSKTAFVLVGRVGVGARIRRGQTLGGIVEVHELHHDIGLLQEHRVAR